MESYPIVEESYKTPFKKALPKTNPKIVLWDYAKSPDDVEKKGESKWVEAIISRPRKIKIQLTNEYIIDISYQFQNLIEEIEKSKYILELPDDWDDEGSPKYEEEVFINAIEFLIKSVQDIKDEFDVIIDTPKILHGPDGSIDVLWKNADYKLLLNISPDENNIATFYGYNSNIGSEIKGKFNYKSKCQKFGLLFWLK